MSFWVGSSASSGNPSLAWSLGNAGKGRLLIKFPFNLHSGWYNEQPCTTFKTFQHRKERKGFRHEFILLKLLDGSVCRVERMGDPDARFDAISPRGSVAHDMAQCFGPHELDQARLDSSDVISEITLPRDFDIMDILHICRAIHEGEKTRNYTLQLYNCWFFSLAIQACLTRFIAHWEDKSLFGVWLAEVNKGIEALPYTLHVRTHSALKRHQPIIFRLYSALFSGNNPSCRNPLAEEIKIRLRLRLARDPEGTQQAIAYRVNNLLWHTTMELGLIHFMEDEIKEVIMNIFENSLGRTFLIPHACSGETSSLTTNVLRNDLRLALRDLLNLANTGSSIDNGSTQFHLKSKNVHDTPFGEEFRATTKANELNFNGKPVGQSTMNMNAIDWYRWLLNHLSYLILWSLHIIFGLWGVELFTFGLNGVLFVAVDDKLGHAVTRLKGLKTVTRSDLERFVDEIRVLTQKQNKFATWRRNPWTDVCELIIQDISVNVLEEIEKGKPNIQFCGYNLNEDFRPRYTSISALQGHIRERIGIHAKEVESVWLGTAASIRIELEDTLSQVWKMIREDEITIQQATQEPERPGDRNASVNAHPIANLAHATTSTETTPDQLAASHAKLAGLLALTEHAGPAQSLAVTAAVAPHLPQILALAKSGQLNAQQLNQLKTLVAMVAKHNGKSIPNSLQRSVQGLPEVPAASGSFPNSPAVMNATPPQPTQQSSPDPMIFAIDDMFQQAIDVNTGQVNGAQGGQTSPLVQANDMTPQQNGQPVQPTTRQMPAIILGRAREIAQQQGRTDILQNARGLLAKFQQQQIERIKAQKQNQPVVQVLAQGQYEAPNPQ